MQHSAVGGNTLSLSSLQSETKELKSWLKNSQNDTRCSCYFGVLILPCVYVGQKEEKKRNRVGKDVCVGTSVYLLFVSVEIPP